VSETPQQPPQQQQSAVPAPVWQRLLWGSASKVAANLWPLVLVHALCDAAVFALHRLSHRLTNEGTEGKDASVVLAKKWPKLWPKPGPNWSW
jgi:hypothetical protein